MLDADMQVVMSAIAAAVGVNSPAFTGQPTAPTPTNTDNSSRLATTAFVQTLITNLLNGAPAAFDTLREIGDAITAGQTADSALVSSIAANTAAIGLRLNINSSQVLTNTQAEQGQANLHISSNDPEWLAKFIASMPFGHKVTLSDARGANLNSMTFQRNLLTDATTVNGPVSMPSGAAWVDSQNDGHGVQVARDYAGVAGYKKMRRALAGAWSAWLDAVPDDLTSLLTLLNGLFTRPGVTNDFTSLQNFSGGITIRQAAPILALKNLSDVFVGVIDSDVNGLNIYSPVGRTVSGQYLQHNATTGKINIVGSGEVITQGTVNSFIDARIGVAQAGMAAGSVGSSAFLSRYGNTNPIVAGNTYAGSTLAYAGVVGDESGSNNANLAGQGAILGGTWRAMGTADATAWSAKATQFLRIL